MKTLKVSKELEGKRLDEAIFLLGGSPSRSKAQALLKKGLVSVNGKTRKAHDPVAENDEIAIADFEEEPTRLKAESIPLNIVYEDEELLIINKPAGLVVHPGNGHQDGTLVNALLGRNLELANSDSPLRPGIVHRIDKDTSGLLVIAKNDAAFAALAKQLSDHSMHREYYALVKGIIYEDDGKIDGPIGRSKTDPLKNAIDLKKGKEAVTYFHVLKRYKEDDVTLVSCRLLTGRTHQIRVHMEYIGHPVIGDPLYGEGNRRLYDKGQLLHAYKLTLDHPKKGEMSFEAPLPKEFEEVLARLK